MSESLQRLVEIGVFSHLHGKLQKWSDEYKINTADENLAKACEIVELNARLQGQLFKLLSLCASEGRLYGAGAAGIKSRLLPLLGQGFFASGLSSDASLSVIKDAVSKECRANEAQKSYEESLAQLEEALSRSRAENEDIKAELESTRQELERQGRASASEKMFDEAELRQLQQRLSEAEADRSRLQSRADLVDDYDRRVRLLRGEIDDLHARLYGPAPLPPPPLPPLPLRLPGPGGCGFPDYFAPPPMSPPPPPPPLTPADGRLARSISGHLAGLHGPPPAVSPLSQADPLLRSRRQALIARYLDLAGSARREASDALRRCYDDEENNQRIIGAAVQEAFSLAKLTFREYKSRVRTQLLLSHVGPASLDEAVQDFINCHHQPEDLQSMTEDVIRALTRDNRLYLPPGISYDVIGPFIRAACQLAWEMATLAQPLELARCRDGEIFDEKKYRRTYDSEFTAPLVAHYTWPALVQGSEVVARGEACTRRGAATSSTEAIDLSGGLDCHQLHRHPHHTGYHGNRQVKPPPSSIPGSVASMAAAVSHCCCCCGGRSTQCCNRTVLNPRCAIPLSCLATPTSDSDEDEEETSGSGCKSPKEETANTANQSNSNSNPNPASVASDYQLGVRWNVDLLALKRRLMTQRTRSTSRNFGSRSGSPARGLESGQPTRESGTASHSATEAAAAAAKGRTGSYYAD